MGTAKLACRLELLANHRIHPMFHVSALKAYKYFPDNYTPPPVPSVIDRHVEHEVDCVTLGRRVSTASISFTGLATTSLPGRM